MTCGNYGAFRDPRHMMEQGNIRNAIALASSVENTDIDRPSGWVALALAAALFAGLLVRQWTFDHTNDIRSGTNQQNAFYWGDRIVHGANPAPGAAGWADFYRSYIAVYEADEARPAADAHTLDYAPLRLLMVGVWVNYLNVAYGPVSQWRPEFARSFAAFSTVLELAGAAAMFAFVARWLRRTGPSECRFLPPKHRGRWEQAAAAAVLFWLNPAAIIDSHICPQSEAWVLPFYLLAVLAMTEGWYFGAGVMLGVGAMFKGQLLLVAPALVMWPMFDRQWSAATRVVLGIACGLGTIAWPWLDHGSFAWARTAFCAHVKFNDVLRKGQSLNLSAALVRWGHLSLHKPVAVLRVAGARLVVDVRSALIVLYGVLLTFCAWGMARQARLVDRRLLVSVAAPWTVMFFALGQMDERYLVWAVCLGTGAIAVGRWPVVAHGALTVAAATTIIQGRLIATPGAHQHLLHLLFLTNPFSAMLTVVGVAILFVGSQAAKAPAKSSASLDFCRSNGTRSQPAA